MHRPRRDAVTWAHECRVAGHHRRRGRLARLLPGARDVPLGHAIGARTFARPLEEMQRTRTLAANQGLYNGFLAAGLVWSLITGSVQVRIFFLACVLIAGLYGGVTASKKILVIQALPAAAGLIATLGLF